MALQTKTISSATTDNGYTLVLELTEVSTSLEDNTSEVSWVLRMTSGLYNFSTWHIGWEIMLDGAIVSSCAREDAPQLSLPTHSSITINSGSATIKHNQDGTLNMAVSAKTIMNGDKDYLPGNMSLSGNMELTTINRGIVYIDNGVSFDAYQAYIDNGTGWDLCIPYIDNGTDWTIVA